MATIHISAADTARDFAALLAHLRAGAEVIIENDAQPIAVMHAAPGAASAFEVLTSPTLENSPAIMDEDFAADVRAALDLHRGPLIAPTRANASATSPS